MSGSGEVIFRQRRCRARDCGAVFYICRCCDRGHGYCSDHCRQTSRRHQLREANRKHQQSLEGRLDHRDHQQAYRERQRQQRVTDQGIAPNSVSVTIPPIWNEGINENAAAGDLHGELVHCAVCGRAGYYISDIIGIVEPAAGRHRGPNVGRGVG